MKQTTKVIFLILAFVFPVSIFVFLKLFGRNEFDVAPLFVTEAPVRAEGCDFTPSLPYVVPDSIQSRYRLSADSLTVIFFGHLSGEELNQLDRVREQTAADPVQVLAATDEPSGTTVKGASTQSLPPSGTDTASTAVSEVTADSDATIERIQRCIFFLNGETDVVMVDRRGVIRGQYSAADRDDIDRMLTEITILLKKY